MEVAPKSIYTKIGKFISLARRAPGTRVKSKQSFLIHPVAPARGDWVKSHTWNDSYLSTLFTFYFHSKRTTNRLIILLTLDLTIGQSVNDEKEQTKKKKITKARATNNAGQTRKIMIEKIVEFIWTSHPFLNQLDASWTIEFFRWTNVDKIIGVIETFAWKYYEKNPQME